VAVQIREAGTEDLHDILRVYREAGLDIEESLSQEKASRILATMKGYPHYKVFVAESEGQVVGTFALLVMENLTHGGVKSGLVEAVGVLPSFQGRGIGKQMMQFAMARCKAEGCYKMALSSNETRAHAHAFYESLGFTRHGFSFKIGMEDPGAGRIDGDGERSDR